MTYLELGVFMCDRSNRRDFLRMAGCTALSATIPQDIFAARKKAGARPNILFCLADDQSYPHAGAYGDKVIKTPSFDRIAKEGVLFNHAYCAAPSCTHSRSGILTGQHI